jgi:hypothetical protein
MSFTSIANGNPLIGTWQSDEKRTLAEVNKVKDMPEKVRNMFENNFFGKLKFRITKDKIFSDFDGNKSEESYEIVSESEKSVTIKTWNDFFNEYQESTYFIEGDSIYAVVSKYEFREYFKRIK